MKSIMHNDVPSELVHCLACLGSTACSICCDIQSKSRDFHHFGHLSQAVSGGEVEVRLMRMRIYTFTMPQWKRIGSGTSFPILAW